MTLKDDPVLQARAQSMLDHCELSNVALIEFSARRHGPNDAAKVHVTSEASFAVDEEMFANRYIWQADLADEQDERVAEFTATFVVEYDIHEGFVPDEAAAEAIADTTGYFAVHPYVRELFHSTCVRLSLNPLVLGLLLRGETKPRTISAPR